MIGVVQKIEFSKSGSKKISIDGKWYFAGKVNVDAMHVGDKVEFEFTEFGEDRGQGRLKGLSTWKPVTDSSGQPQTGSTISDADVLRSVSNIVGNACAAGTIKSPQELESWFSAAWAGFTRRTKSATGREPGMDDELPPGHYESENPAPPARTGTGGRW